MPMPGIKVGYLPQEPQLDPEADRARGGRGRPRRGAAGARSARRGLRRLRRGRRRLRQARRRAGEATRRSSPPAARDTPSTSSRSPPTRCACRRGTRRSATLSGGEKRRVALCRLLLSQARHAAARRADQPPRRRSVEWLEQFLQQFPGTVVAVTHDRYFLDNAAEWILELDRGRGIPWKGNYSRWLEQKERAPEAGGVDARRRARRRSRRSSSGCARTPRAARPRARRAWRASRS